MVTIRLSDAWHHGLLTPTLDYLHHQLRLFALLSDYLHQICKLIHLSLYSTETRNHLRWVNLFRNRHVGYTNMLVSEKPCRPDVTPKHEPIMPNAT